jgi:hypothetical protein
MASKWIWVKIQPIHTPQPTNNVTVLPVAGPTWASASRVSDPSVAPESLWRSWTNEKQYDDCVAS